VAEPALSEVEWAWRACIYSKAADTAAATLLISDIRVIRGVSKNPENFPRKGSKNFTQYISERPEMTTQLRGLKEGQNKKGN
jgi:hypothetical protein